MTSITTITDWQAILILIVTALFTGIGSAIGSYIANKGLISRLEKRLNRLKKKK